MRADRPGVTRTLLQLELVRDRPLDQDMQGLTKRLPLAPSCGSGLLFLAAQDLPRRLELDARARADRAAVA